MKRTRSIPSLIAVIACVLSISACSGNVSKTDDSMAGADTGKFASSTTDFIDSMLNNRQYGESQKKVLRTALQHDGKIPYAAYSTAWESYRQCLMERGTPSRRRTRATEYISHPSAFPPKACLTRRAGNWTRT